MTNKLYVFKNKPPIYLSESTNQEAYIREAEILGSWWDGDNALVLANDTELIIVEDDYGKVGLQ